jgi:tyrosine-protein kinase Etk/Wzc
MEPTSETDEVSFLDYLLVLAKHSRFIIYTTLTITFLTCLHLYCQPNRYTAEARLLPPEQNLNLSAQVLASIGIGSSGTASTNHGLSGMVASSLGLQSPYDQYLGMMQSNTVIDRINQQFKLQEFFRVKAKEKARNILKNMVNLKIGKDSLILIKVTDEDKNRAAQIANAFGEELDRLLQELYHQDAANHLVFLEKERLQASHDLSKMEEALRAFSEKSSVIQIDAQTKGMIEYIAKLRAEIDIKEVQIQVLRKQATPLNYDVVRLETELNGLKEKLRAAESQVDASCVGDVCIATGKVPALGLKYLRLYREAKYQESLYQLYCKLVDLARLDAARNVSMVFFVDRATPPDINSNRRFFLTFMVGLATFVILTMVAFACEYWQNLRNNEGNSQRLALLAQYLKPWSHLVKPIRNLYQKTKRLRE